MKKKLLWLFLSLLAALFAYLTVGLVLVIGGFEIALPNDRLLVSAAAHDDLPGFKRIAAKGVSIDVQEKGFLGETPLIASIASPGTNVFYYLLASGAKIDARGRGGITPLMKSTGCGDLKFETTKALVQAGADVNLKDDHGISVLSYAEQAGVGNHVPTISNTISFLKEHGAK